MIILTLNPRVVEAIPSVVVAIPKLRSPSFQIVSSVELRRNLRRWWASQRIQWNVPIGIVRYVNDLTEQIMQLNNVSIKAFEEVSILSF